MRLAFITWDLRRSGGVRAILEIANRLMLKGYKVDIISLYGGSYWFKNKVPTFVLQHNIQANYLRELKNLVTIVPPEAIYYADKVIKKINIKSKSVFLAKAISKLSEAITKSRYLIDPEIYIATYFLTALALFRSKTYSKECYYFLQDFPELVMEVNGLHGLKLFLRSLKLPFRFICNSNYTRHIVLHHNPFATVDVCGVGVDLNVFKPCKPLTLLSGSEKRYVMTFLRGRKFKGDEIAVRTLNLLHKKMPIHALIVGSAWAARRAFIIKPRFSYTLFQNINDSLLAKLYSTADVFLFTSLVESFGLPPLEAMACGTPVVTTDCKGNRDYAKHGYNCLIVQPNDPVSAAEAITTLLKNDQLRDKLVKNGLSTARKFSWNIIVEKFEKLLRG